MKRRNILVISIVSISVLLIITIASGILGFTHYKYEFSKSISSTWNNSKSLFNRSNEENFYPPVPIVVVYKTKKVGDITARARQGLIIVIPNGDTEDPTRKPEYYDATFNYLKSLGIPVI